MSSSLRFSANLGFLWADRALPDAVRAAAHAGFDAVECHWPYETDPAELQAALNDTGLPLLSLNTHVGDKGMFGMAAVPDDTARARDAIAQAFDYASSVGAQAVHLMAGKAEGARAHDTFLDNLNYACGLAGQNNKSILIEPINTHDIPGYFLRSADQAAEIITMINNPSVKMMFDCYHMAKMGVDVISTFKAHQQHIGHVQFAGVPDRGRPDYGSLDYGTIFQAMMDMGWKGYLGAEYKPDAHDQGDYSSGTDASLDWLNGYRG